VIFYRMLLLLYPASFRAEYGREMLGVFERRRQQTTTVAGRAMLWLDAIVDILSNAPALLWDMLRQDLRFAFRSLRRSPTLGATVMLVAALGIGATTATFTLADHVLIRPMPFHEPERLVKLWQAAATGARWELSPGNYRDWESQATSFDGMAAFMPTSANLLGTGAQCASTGALLPATSSRSSACLSRSLHRGWRS
jgi:hypothetical protein